MQITHAQASFLQSTSRCVIYIGGIGAGKTFILCHKGVQSALKKRRFCLFSFSYPMLRDVIVPTMKEVLESLDIPYIYNKSDKIFLINGQELLLRSADDPDSIRGLNLDDAGIDEAAFVKEEAYQIIIGRMRNSKDGQLFISTTPKGTKSWVFKLTQDDSSYVVRQSTFKNPFLPDSYIQHLRSQYSSKFAKQELEGEFIDFSAGVIESKWFKEVNPYRPKRGVRFWDLAVSTKKAADNSAGALCSFDDERFVIHDIRFGKYEYPDLRREIIKTALADGEDIVICVEEAGQQRGFIDDLKRIPELRNYVIKAEKPRGDKLNRALPWVSRAELGNVHVCSGLWNNAFYDECNSFTADDTHSHDDLIDSVSGGYQHLTNNIQTAKFVNFSWA